MKVGHIGRRFIFIPYVYIKMMNPLLTLLFITIIISATIGATILWGGFIYAIIKDYIEDRF
jgi:hypothetical protein